MDIATSWAAEWCGKLAAIRLASLLSVPPSSVAWSIADNVSATLGTDGGRPSNSPLVDRIRLAFAAALAGSGAGEGFTPAEHDSGWTHLVARLQSSCHDLAATGARLGRPLSIPFPDLHSESVLLFRSGRVAVAPSASLDRLYAELHPSPPAALPLPESCDYGYRRWAELAETNTLTPGSLRLAALLRAAPLFPTS